MAFIELKQVKFAYTDSENRPIPVIHGVDLSVEKGEFVAILGRNGSGKSTLAKLIDLILAPSDGTITVDGTVLRADMSEEEVLAVRKKVGMVFQNPDNQMVASVVREDIAFGPENLGCPPDEIRRRVEEALKTVGMTEYAEHSPSKLSGGQKQRIAIAGVIAMLPECIIFDEATAMLDPSGRADVMNTILKLNKERGITVLHITHNMEEAVLADKVAVIDKGTVYTYGTPEEVFSQSERLEKVGLEVPMTAKLCTELKKAGFPLAKCPLDPDEAVKAIVKVLEKEGRA